jgi:penicillin-binding protein 1A
LPWFKPGCLNQLVCGVWVGCEDPDVHFVSTTSGQGSRTALPIWGSFMNKVYSTRGLPYKRSVQFPAIDSTSGVNLNCALPPVVPVDSTAVVLP